MTNNYADWFNRVYPELHNYGLALRGGEPGKIPATEYTASDFKILFARLSTYTDTLDSFSHRILYDLAGKIPGTFPDLTYLPMQADTAIMDRDEIPWLLPTECKQHPRDFDLIGFSNSIVQELINLPTLLRKSQIPLKKSERLKDPKLPLLILGGSNALHSSIAWSKDPWIDGVFIGEDLEAITKLLTLCRDAKINKLSKQDTLKKLTEEIPGFFEPENPKTTARATPRKYEHWAAKATRPIPFDDTTLGSAPLAITEGCPEACSFCAESWGRKPYRERPLENAIKEARQAQAELGLDSIDLYSFNFNLYSQLEPLIWELTGLFRCIGLKSQRLDAIAENPRILALENAVGKNSFTFGIEGISARLRRYLGKNLDDDVLNKGLTQTLKTVPREMKLFFITTGLEQEEDYAEFSALLAKLRELQTPATARTRIIISATPLVRFPWTPLEFADAPTAATTDQTIKRLSAITQQSRFEFRDAASAYDAFVSQLLVRASDPRLTEALESASQNFVHYRGITRNFSQLFSDELTKRGIQPESLLKGHLLETPKPWAEITTGVSRQYLYKRFEEVSGFGNAQSCRTGCPNCGACTTNEERTTAKRPQTKAPQYNPENIKTKRANAQRQETKVTLAVNIGPAARGTPQKAWATVFASALMLEDQKLIGHYRGHVGSLLDTQWLEGYNEWNSNWTTEGARYLASKIDDPEFLKRVNTRIGNWGNIESSVNPQHNAYLAKFDTTFPFRPDNFLLKQGLKFTLRKPGDGSIVYEFTRDALKKKILTSLKANSGNVTAEFGAKFDINAFTKEAFILPTPKEWVKIRTRISRSAI